ncbi:hypothetical protein PN456_05130 [Nodularia spumigena CS-586/05]|uniref:hypothetical protein n=1 Tax=Nodularia spumigena TaxID=70799 RepID=UPI00232F790D|nr:hypothetical protein [Nodularia spumigena]MDB9368342.1 hypothetical protein [Nodularia spumigena CS-586/05]
MWFLAIALQVGSFHKIALLPRQRAIEHEQQAIQKAYASEKLRQQLENRIYELERELQQECSN